MALKDGSSVGVVEQQAGEPASEFGDEDGELTLNYPGWQIFFSDGHMVRRVHEVLRRQAGGIAKGDPPSALVLSLKRGMSAAQVVGKLGRPDVVEVEYEGHESADRVLRYGAWELRFRNGALQDRMHR